MEYTLKASIRTFMGIIISSLGFFSPNLLQAQTDWIASDTLVLKDPMPNLPLDQRSNMIQPVSSGIVYHVGSKMAYFESEQADPIVMDLSPGKRTQQFNISNVERIGQEIFCQGSAWYGIYDLESEQITQSFWEIVNGPYLLNLQWSFAPITYRQLGTDTLDLYVSLYAKKRKKYAKEGLYTPGHLQDLKTNTARIQRVRMVRKSGKWKRTEYQDFGSHKGDRMFEVANFNNHYNHLISCGDGMLFSGSYTHDIWEYDFEGNMVQQISAQGAAMPEEFMATMKALNETEMNHFFENSGTYNAPKYVPNTSWMLRTYRTPPTDGKRQYFLQIIHQETHEIFEIPIQEGFAVRAIYQGKMILSETPIQENGYLKFPLYDIPTPK
ncbi:hypothetical protein [Pontibacter sp. G13]|uniref:hypothetical protein n=1 Tax=Pontibacter sp. G13 TaxID=3074898 RepID=UPI0028899CD9|nr:hypothetical protein [Pontibacter sp. G13]WNJ20554.1 hypothetical protein RJD25_08730 [Pontibacter sp. G13]